MIIRILGISPTNTGISYFPFHEEHTFPCIITRIYILFITFIACIFDEFLRNHAQFIIKQCTWLLVIITWRKCIFGISAAISFNFQVFLTTIRKGPSVNSSLVILQMPASQSIRTGKTENYFIAHFIVPVERFIPVIRNRIISELSSRDTFTHIDTFLPFGLSNPLFRIQIKTYQQCSSSRLGKLSLLTAITRLSDFGR